jgi:hypothetical protein
MSVLLGVEVLATHTSKTISLKCRHTLSLWERLHGRRRKMGHLSFAQMSLTLLQGDTNQNKIVVKM